MPTANANTGNGFKSALSYAMQEKKQLPEELRAEVLQLNNVAGSSREIARQMREISLERPSIKKPVLHMQINFHPDEKLTKDAANNAIDAILKEVGIDRENNQFIVVQHSDKAHDHYHVIANRVGLDGGLISNEKILDRLQVACDKVEQEQGLRRTDGRTILYDPTSEKGFRYATKEEKALHSKGKATKMVFKDKNPFVKEGKEQIRDKAIDVLAVARTPQELKNKLAEKGVEVRFSTNRSENDRIIGASFRTENLSVKGGDIGFKWAEIEAILDRNRENSIWQMENQPVVELMPGKEKQQADPAGIIFPVSEPIKIAKEEFEYVQPKVEPNDFGIREPVFEKLSIRPIKDDKDIWEDNMLPKTEKSLKSAVLHLENELAKGNIAVDFEDILQKEGLRVNPTTKNIEFAELNQRFVLASFDDILSERKKIAENALRVYREETARYKQLMAKQPEKISFKDQLFGGDEKKEKERFNEQLQKRKETAKKPVYKVRDSFKKLSVEVKTDFTKKMENFERKKLEVQSRNFSKVTAYKINVQNMIEERLGIKKDNNRGLSL